MNNDAHQYSESAVQIDELNLDKECIRLPSDYLKFAHAAVDAKHEVDEVKNRLEVVEADLAREIRNTPAKFGIEKDTEKAIAAAVIVQERYQKGLSRLNAAKHAADLAQAVVSALEHKKRSLTLLVELHGLGYFANPKVTRSGKDAVEQMSKQRALRKAGYLNKED